jgi:hypothetical protein
MAQEAFAQGLSGPQWRSVNPDTARRMMIREVVR